MKYRVTCTYHFVITREIEAKTEEEAEDQAWEIRQATNILECECIESEQEIELIEEEEEQGQRCCVCGLPAEGGEEQECACVCPACGTHTFNDITLGDQSICWNCHRLWQLCSAAPQESDNDARWEGEGEEEEGSPREGV